MPRIEIQRLTSTHAYQQCERLQREVWGNTAVSSEVLSVTQKYGGIVLGAVSGGNLVGLLYAFLARYHGQLVHWSHLMAVDRRFRDQGLGFKMKLTHRKIALQEGIRSICWTFDPLQSRNAMLNIFRLGAKVEEYIPDCYGHFMSLIERGLPSDRFVVKWQIGSARVIHRLRGSPSHATIGLPKVNETYRNEQGFIVNRRTNFPLEGRRLLLEIPANTDEMRTRDLRLARRWREESRRMFQRAIEADYRISDFVMDGTADDRRAFYILGRTRNP